MDELAAGLAEYMDEEAAKGSGEKVEPNATEEATSAPCAAPTDAIEASPPPPPGATGETPPVPPVDQSAEAALLTDPSSSWLYYGFLIEILYAKFINFLLLLLHF